MKKEVIKDKDRILAVILREGDFPEGLSFHTEEKDFVQLATWYYNKGKKTSTHSHKIAERKADRTQEVIYLKRGKAKVEIYAEDDKLLSEIILKAGDLIIIFGGGHGFEILEDGTQAIEFKNGPYLGLEKDRRLLI
ncbi:MAG: hypothetical protein Q8P63_01450 [Candidatus Nealsonbacteria bacterium]|nr:hypothetical protein [Candidatus Nealsonbacteria bacterium]